jgi:hypothetical protein
MTRQFRGNLVRLSHHHKTLRRPANRHSSVPPRFVQVSRKSTESIALSSAIADTIKRACVLND